jgi:dienelactone hydrolase
MTTISRRGAAAGLFATVTLALLMYLQAMPIRVELCSAVHPVLDELVASTNRENPASETRSAPAILATPRVENLTFSAGPRGAETRTSLVSLPGDQRAHPVLVNLHGMCNAPEYSCAPWLAAAGESHFVTCPRGGERCGADGGFGPYWARDAALVDEDLNRAIDAIDRESGGRLERAGAVLTGFSRGGYLALDLAKREPGRWPYLVIVEADVRVDAAMLEKAGVKAIAFVTGELSTQRRGMEKSAAALSTAGVRSKLWVMPGAGHAYSTDIAAIAKEALTFIEAGRAGAGG